MKKYVSLLSFLFLLTSANLGSLFLMTVGREDTERAGRVRNAESVEKVVFENEEEIHASLEYGQI